MGYNKLPNTNGIFKNVSVTDDEHFTVGNINSTFGVIMNWTQSISVVAMIILSSFFGIYNIWDATGVLNKLVVALLVIYNVVTLILLRNSRMYDTDNDKYYSYRVWIMLTMFSIVIALFKLTNRVKLPYFQQYPQPVSSPQPVSPL